MYTNTPLTVSTRPAPLTQNRRVPPRRIKNSAVRSREYLTPNEVARLMDAAGTIGRHRLRDRTLVLLAYRHALRVAELVSLRWSQIDLEEHRLHVHRVKHGTPSVHPLRAPEIRALRRLKQVRRKQLNSCVIAAVLQRRRTETRLYGGGWSLLRTRLC